VVHPSCGYSQLHTQLRVSLLGTDLGQMLVFGQHGCDLVMALPRGSYYPFLQDPQLQIAAPPPPIDRVAMVERMRIFG
jgi:hypothetical protein